MLLVDDGIPVISNTADVWIKLAFDIDMFEVAVTVEVLNATPLNALVILSIFVPAS